MESAGRRARGKTALGRASGASPTPVDLRMKVLHLTLSYSHGGRREAIAALAQGMVDLGVESHLGCLDAFGSEPAERALFAGSFSLDRSGVFDGAALRQLRDYCRVHAIDVVHAHDAASEAMAVFAMPLGGPALLMSFHRTRDLETARFRDRLRNALVGLRVGAVVTASQERLRHYVDNNYINRAKVSCIPLGIDLDRFRPDTDARARSRMAIGADEGTFLVGTVGHFGAEKGVDIAVCAFQAFLRHRPGFDARLAILGRGDAEQTAWLQAKIEPEFAGRIQFMGFKTDPEQWFPAFDVLLHGARDEAFGLVLAEAQACGVPVVAARVGGIPEVVLDGETGRLAQTPSVEALAEMLDNVACNQEHRLGLVRRTVEHVRSQFSRERYARDYIDVYRRLLD